MSIWQRGMKVMSDVGFPVSEEDIRRRFSENHKASPVYFSDHRPCIFLRNGLKIASWNVQNVMSLYQRLDMDFFLSNIHKEQRTKERARVDALRYPVQFGVIQHLFQSNINILCCQEVPKGLYDYVTANIGDGFSVVFDEKYHNSNEGGYMCISRGTASIASTEPILDEYFKRDGNTARKLNCVLINTTSGLQILNIHLPIECQDVSLRFITDSDQLAKDGREVIFCGDFNYKFDRSKHLIESFGFSVRDDEQFSSEQRYGDIDHCFSARFRRSARELV
jgi:exonuclease III